MLHPSVLTRTRDPSHPFRDSPASGASRGRQGATVETGVPHARPALPWRGDGALRGPASWGGSLPSQWLATAPGHGSRGRHCATMSHLLEAGRPPGSPPHPCWIGVPYEAPPCRAAPFPALGLPPSRPARHRQAGSSSTGPGRGAAPHAPLAAVRLRRPVVDIQPSPGLPSLGTPRARSRDSPPADLTDRLPGSLPGPCPSVS